MSQRKKKRPIVSRAVITVNLLADKTLDVAAFGPSDATDKTAEKWCGQFIKLMVAVFENAGAISVKFRSDGELMSKLRETFADDIITCLDTAAPDSRRTALLALLTKRDCEPPAPPSPEPAP